MDLLYTAHVPPGDGPFPTIVALHGWGANAHDLLGLAPILNGGEALVLSPQGPVVFAIAQGVPGYGWFDLTRGGPPQPGEVKGAADAVESFLESAGQRYPIDPRKRVLLGFSQGGVIGYELALRDPSGYAGLAALSSWLPEELVAGNGSPDLSNLPVFVTHGTEDPMIPVDRARESRERLTAMNALLTYREHEMQHEIRPEALRDLIGWLDGKVLNPIQLA